MAAETLAMSDAGFVAGAWLVTGVVLSGYATWLVRRLRRAERSLLTPGADDVAETAR